MSTEYFTVIASESSKFDAAVTKKLGEGFDLYGDPFAWGNYFCQAVVKGMGPKKRVLQRPSVAR